MGKIRIHKKCGGAIRNNECTLCHKRFGKMARFFAAYYDEVEVPDKEPMTPKKWRKRIRRGEDIFR